MASFSASSSSSSLSEDDVMSITPLGAGQEVGRSCHVVEFRGVNIMLDMGIHPGYEGLNGLPFLDRIEPDQIDALLITHFHLDHAASLPYWTERTGFKGRIFMTHPTKAVLRLLLGDYIRLYQMRRTKSEDMLYTEEELASCLNKVELIDYHTTVTLPGGVSFYAMNAGHVLGACMFWISFVDVGRSLLYTGDYSMEEDRHLMAAEVPATSPDVLITESTFGVQVHASRQEREARFSSTVERVVTRGGRCLIPVFALGRAQELLLILDEYWQANPHLQNVPIWYASKLASRSLRVYQTYANMMNVRIRSSMDVSNPFRFRFIQNLKSIDVNQFDDSRPSVVFASPGMLQSGVSRQLFDRWAPDPKNGVMLAGYAVEHTLAKEIMLQPKEVVTLEGRKQPLNCLVDYVSFSAHVDFVQNRNFITQVAPKHIILVHGQKDEMGRLKSALMTMYKQYPENKRPTITMPPNLQEVKLKFARRITAKVMGSLAEGGEPAEGDHVSGIMVTNRKDGTTKIVAPCDLATFTPLRLGTIQSKLHVPFAGSIETLRLYLTEMFANLVETNHSIPATDGDENNNTGEVNVTTFGLYGNEVKVTLGTSRGVAIVDWMASPAGDVIADSVVALIMHAQSSSASIRLSSKPCNHGRDIDQTFDENEESFKKRKSESIDRVQDRLELLFATLKEQFDDVEATYEGSLGTFEITTDSGFDDSVLDDDGKLRCTVEVRIERSAASGADIKVESRDAILAENIRGCLRNVVAASAPIET